jgi:integrase
LLAFAHSTLLAGMGCPAEIAEAILGHQLPGIQATYNRHSYDAERREWLTKLAARLEALAGA